ncbi:MAG TPA: hypothetical protein VJT31_05135 [Rugosimonospora sp.]|nr:hypothetical protein [Rugosimonospora sp.]
MRTNSLTTVRILVGTATAAMALSLAAACGSGSGTTPASGSGGGGAATGGMATAAAPSSVSIVETRQSGADHYAFSVATADVTGDALTIVNKTDENQALTCTGPAPASITVNKGETGTLKFNGDGTYHCTTNKGAKITLTVA